MFNNPDVIGRHIGMIKPKPGHVSMIEVEKGKFFEKGVVALKGVFELQKEDFGEVEKFLDKVIAKQWSPYLVKYLCYSDSFDIFNVVMEYCGGGNLKTFLQKRKKLKARWEKDEMEEIIGQLTVGLYVLHNEIQTLHGDVKMENILLSGKNWKLSDYGIKERVIKQANNEFRDPEVIVKKKNIVDISEKADMMGMGKVFQEIVTICGLVSFNDNSIPGDLKGIILSMISEVGKPTSVLDLIRVESIANAIQKLPYSFLSGSS